MKQELRILNKLVKKFGVLPAPVMTSVLSNGDHVWLNWRNTWDSDEICRYIPFPDEKLGMFVEAFGLNNIVLLREERLGYFYGNDRHSQVFGKDMKDLDAFISVKEDWEKDADANYAKASELDDNYGMRDSHYYRSIITLGLVTDFNPY